MEGTPAPPESPSNSKSSRQRIIMMTSFGILGSGIGGLAVAGRQEAIADLILGSVFGTGWAFNDFFSYVLAPLLSVIILPISVAGGGVIGILLARKLAN